MEKEIKAKKDNTKKNNKKSKNKSWIKFRHRVVRNIAYAILYPYSKIKYGITIEKFKEQEKRPYLVLMNHQTPFDQFFVGMAFKGPVYYLASEDIFSNGFVSSLIRYLVAPIPIKKQTVDLKAIINCIKVSKEGGTIAIAPEGNRTYSGRTEYMSPAIASMARKLSVPIVLYRLEGGYGVQPRWSDVIRKGKMRGYVSKVIMPEEYASLTDNELFELIKNELTVNENCISGDFYSKKSAEYLERAMYVCPYCGLSQFESENDVIECKKCSRKIKYLSTKQLKGIDFDFPFEFVAEWYDSQENFINSLDLKQFEENYVYKENVSLYSVIPNKKKKLINTNSEIKLFGNRIEIEFEDKKIAFDFNETSAVTVLGRNKLNIYHEKNIYQIKGRKRFNALKYVHFYHRYQNVMKGDGNGKFLGL